MTRSTDDETEIGFDVITAARCRELVAERSVGRIAWQSADGPQILPVSYAWFDNRLVFRTSRIGMLAELIEPTDVALEVDDLDEHRRRGWSVVVHGRAEEVGEPARLVELWTIDGAVPWASGVRNVFIEITVHSITGRTVDARAQ